ncbi:MAG: hypothetical protein U0531_00170 [Dehalococcoidia bacterium]
MHINAGVAALACVIALGPRKGFGREPFRPHSLPLTLLGTGILWFGWFGFNAGSALGANALAGSAFVTTHIAASLAALGWVAAGELKTAGHHAQGRLGRGRRSGRHHPAPASSDRWRRLSSSLAAPGSVSSRSALRPLRV